MNIQDFYIGKSFDAYEFFGAHKIGDKILFRVYAPNAAKVSLVGEFNDWQEEAMEQQHQRNGDMSRPKIKDGGKIQNIGVILCLVDGMRL